MTRVATQVKLPSVEWIGDIPEGWHIKPLKALFTSKKQTVGKHWDDYRLLRLSLDAVSPKQEGQSGKNPENYESYQVFKGGDLVFCAFDYDVTPRTIGIVQEEGMLTGAYTRLIPLDGVSSKYYYYYYLALDNKKELLHLCTGLRNGIGKHILWKLPNPFPPQEVQERISYFLDKKTAKIDELIKKKKKLIELLKERRISIITHAVTKGLNPNAKMKRLGVEWIGNIPEEWDLLRARFLFREKSEKNHQDAELLSVYRDYGVIPTSSRDDNHNKPSEDLSSYKFVESGDLVFNKMKTWQGSIAISSYEGIVSPAYYVAQLTREDKVSRAYIHHLLRSRLYISKYASISTGIRPGQWDMSFEKFKDVEVLLPPIGDQNKIVTFIEEHTNRTDDMLSKIEKQIELLTEYRTSLIYHAVTGKIST